MNLTQRRKLGLFPRPAGQQDCRRNGFRALSLMSDSRCQVVGVEDAAAGSCWPRSPVREIVSGREYLIRAACYIHGHTTKWGIMMPVGRGRRAGGKGLVDADQRLAVATPLDEWERAAP